MEEEIWKDVIGYENLYQVSNFGRVKSLKFGKEKILKSADNGWGYLTVDLYRDGKRSMKTVHRLVAEAFIPNPENKPQIDHINTVRTDNRVSNLRWTTRGENCRNPISIEHHRENAPRPMKGKFGKEHHNSKQIIQYSLENEFIKEWDSLMDVQRELGIYQSSISACCKGRLKSSGGYRWEYKN